MDPNHSAFSVFSDFWYVRMCVYTTKSGQYQRKYRQLCVSGRIDSDTQSLMSIGVDGGDIRMLAKDVGELTLVAEDWVCFNKKVLTDNEFPFHNNHVNSSVKGGMCSGTRDV